MEPLTEDCQKYGGSAFQANHLNSTRPVTRFANSNQIKPVSLTEWCDKNFITKRIGRKLIRLKYLVAFRRHHVWWVAANPECMDQLLEYLGVEELLFDAGNSSPVVDP